MPQSRQLAAIMFTDIVGYTALMGNDEKHAFILLNKNRQLQKPIVGSFDGRWIKEIGDGTMASFNTVSDAVHAAIKIQEACNTANDFQLRIGIHQGEVVFENDDVFGDAVNIAARIQAAASPGCIFISETVNHNISNKKEIITQFVKEEILKNVSQPVRMYQVMTSGSKVLASNPSGKVALPNTGNKIVHPSKRTWKLASISVIVIALALAAYLFYQRKPAYEPGETERSIAVLPFVNMSNDAEQEFFSDGISEEIINALAQVPALKVIGRTSSFAFKGKNQDLKVIGEQLKVSYILEGSVRRSGNKLRVTAQLINVTDGYHLYSQTFDQELEDVFKIQDDISQSILKAVKIKLLSSEKNAVLKKYTDNVEAYQLYLQGRFYYNKFTKDAFMKAIEYFDRAIAKDPNYAIAFSGKAYCYMLFDFFGLPSENNMSEALKAAQQSLDLDSEIAQSHLAVGRIKFHWEWNFKQAEEHFMKALSIEPNNAETHVQLAMLSTVLGNKEMAMKHYQIAINLDPFSLMNLYMATIAPGIFGEMQTVLENGKRMIDLDSTFYGGHFWVGLAHIQSGRPQEGFVSIQLAVQLENDPLTLSFLGSVYGFMGDKLKAREVIKQLESMQPVNGYIGDVYASIGELDKAFYYYNKAVEMHEGNMLWVKTALMNNPELKQDPRTMKLLKRIGIPH